MGFSAWIKDKAKAVQSTCRDAVSQLETEARALPKKIAGNTKKVVAGAKSLMFGKESASSKKSIAETVWGKHLTQTEVKAYNEYVANRVQGKEYTPAQRKAFMKVQGLKEKALTQRFDTTPAPLFQREFQADESINKSIAIQGEAQQRAYSGGKAVLDFVSFGGADHLEKARYSVEQGKGLAAAGHTTAGLGLTAIGAYFTVAEAGNLAYSGSKWLFKTAKSAIPKAPGVILSAGKAVVQGIKNPKLALESAKAVGRALRGASGEILSKASTGLKNLASTKLTQLGETVSVAGRTLNSFKKSETAKQTLRMASGKLVESTGRLLSNIKANPQTYVLKAGAGALGVEWAGHAVSDFKKGHTGSGLLNTAFALTVPSMIQFTTPALLASREKLSALNSAEIREFGVQLIQKASRGVSNVCERAIAYVKNLPQAMNNFNEALQAGAKNLFSGTRLAGAGGYGNINAKITSFDEQGVIFKVGKTNKIKREITDVQIVLALWESEGELRAVCATLRVKKEILMSRIKKIRKYRPDQLRQLAEECGFSEPIQVKEALNNLGSGKGPAGILAKERKIHDRIDADTFCVILNSSSLERSRRGRPNLLKHLILWHRRDGFNTMRRVLGDVCQSAKEWEKLLLDMIRVPGDDHKLHLLYDLYNPSKNFKGNLLKQWIKTRYDMHLRARGKPRAVSLNASAKKTDLAPPPKPAAMPAPSMSVKERVANAFLLRPSGNPLDSAARSLGLDVKIVKSEMRGMIEEVTGHTVYDIDLAEIDLTKAAQAFLGGKKIPLTSLFISPSVNKATSTVPVPSRIEPRTDKVPSRPKAAKVVEPRSPLIVEENFSNVPNLERLSDTHMKTLFDLILKPAESYKKIGISNINIICRILRVKNRFDLLKLLASRGALKTKPPCTSAFKLDEIELLFLECLPKAATYEQIGNKMGISTKLARKIWNKLQKMFKCENKFELFLKSLREGLVAPSLPQFEVYLTEKERGICKLIIENKSKREIAEALGIKEASVRRTSGLFKKISGKEDEVKAAKWMLERAEGPEDVSRVKGVVSARDPVNKVFADPEDISPAVGGGQERNYYRKGRAWRGGPKLRKLGSETSLSADISTPRPIKESSAPERLLGQHLFFNKGKLTQPDISVLQSIINREEKEAVAKLAGVKPEKLERYLTELAVKTGIKHPEMLIIEAIRSGVVTADVFKLRLGPDRAFILGLLQAGRTDSQILEILSWNNDRLAGEYIKINCCIRK